MIPAVLNIISQGFQKCKPSFFFFERFFEKSEKKPLTNREAQSIIHMLSVRDCVRVAQLTLDQFVWVRILVTQPTKKRLLSTDKRRFFERCLPCRANDACFAHDVAFGNDVCLRAHGGKHYIIASETSDIISEKHH